MTETSDSELVKLCEYADAMAATLPSGNSNTGAVLLREAADRIEALTRPVGDGEAVAPESQEEWQLEQRAFTVVNGKDVPEHIRLLVSDLWRQYCLAAAPHTSRDGVLEEAANDFASQGNAAYVAMIRTMESVPALGWEAKARSGEFGKEELDAHKTAAEYLGKHRAFIAAAQVIRALKSNPVPAVEPVKGDGK